MDNPKTIPGKTYAVTSPNGCTVTTEDGLTLAEIEAGHQGYFVAVGSKVSLSDDSAILTQLFNLAPYQKLRLLGVVGGGNNSGLPTGYTRLAYLESTGSQYIDTNYIPSASTGVRASVYTKGVLDYIPFGCRNDSSSDSRFTSPRKRIGNGGVGSSGFGWGNWLFFEEYSLKVINEVEFEGSTNWLNSGYAQIVDKLEGVTQSSSFPPLPFTPEFSLYIFSCNVGGTSSYSLGCKIYKASISEQKEVIRKFVPAIDPTGIPCMVDTVSKTPLFNSGGGEFICGIETQKQLAALLRKLPDRTGQDVGTLQVRLADDLQTPANEAKLDAMLSKNWEISQAA